MRRHLLEDTQVAQSPALLDPSGHSTFHCNTLKGWEGFYPWTQV